MAEIDISIQGVDEASAMFEEVAEKVEKIKQTLPQQLADEIISEARSNLQNNTSVVSADLLNSIGVLEETDDSITVGTELEYAQYVEYGRGPVTATNAKALHFFTKDGKEIFTKSVGPAEPRPFFWPAVQRILTGIKEKVNDLLE